MIGLEQGLVLSDRFVLVHKVGEGGMGDVWLAEDSTLRGIPVALKVLKGELMGDKDAVRRMEDEALAARRLNHPNVVRTHDLHRHGDLYFISIEYVEGQSLAAELADNDGPLPVE